MKRDVGIGMIAGLLAGIIVGLMTDHVVALGIVWMISGGFLGFCINKWIGYEHGLLIGGCIGNIMSFGFGYFAFGFLPALQTSCCLALTIFFIFLINNLFKEKT